MASRTKAVDECRSWMAGAGAAIVVVFALTTAAHAQGDQLLATVDKPAVVTAVPAAERGASAKPARIVIDVTGFKPPQDGQPVQAVVSVRKEGGTEQEIGRFGLFPQTEFRAASPSEAQRFSVPLPSDLAGGSAVTLNVQLVPSRGKGEGARLELGGAQIR